MQSSVRFLFTLLTLVAVALTPAPAARAQTEIQPFTTHGTLRVIKADDYYVNASLGTLKGGFYGITGVPLNGNFYFYVGSGATNGFNQGPGQECAFEDTMVFEVPYTHNGMRGTGGMTYRGVATPCTASDPPGGVDGFNMPGGALLYTRTIDGVAAKVVLTSHHTKTGSNFDKVLFGYSANGIDFSWKVLYQVSTSASFFTLSPHLQPDPSNPNRLWGLVPFQVSGSGNFSAACIEVLFNGGSTANATVRVSANSTCTSWNTIPFGGTLSATPVARSGTAGFRVQSLQKVDGQYWAAAFDVTSPNPGNAPCNPSSEPYATNVTFPGNSTANVREIDLMSVTPSFGTGPRLDLMSDTRDFPRAYLGSMRHPFLVEDKQGKNLLYTSSQDWFICSQPFGAGQGSKGDIVLTVLDEGF